MNLFKLDSMTYRIATKIYQVLLLSVLWYITSLPIITIGASTCALFYVSSKLIREEETHIVKDFLKAIKDNFLRATIIGIIFFAIGVLFRGNIIAYLNQPGLSKIFMVIQLIMLLELFVVMIYSFPILSRYDLGVLKTLKASLLIGNRHFGTTIQSLIFVATTIALLSIYPTLFMFLAPGIIGISNYYIINKVLVRYTSEIGA